jgi:DNA repair protein RadC
MSDLFAETLTLSAQPARTAPVYGVSGLQERAAKFGCETLADFEALELLLSRAAPKLAGNHARALLQRYNSLGAVLAAPPQALAQMVGTGAALDLKLVHEAALRVAGEKIARRCVISSWTSVLAYLKVSMQHNGREAFRVLYLDKKNQLIADEIMNNGTVDHAPVYPREVAKRALELDASAVIFVHNHPSGDPTPSSADVDMTRQLVEALKPLRVAVHDHLVVGRDGVASFKSLGLM